MSDYTSLDIYHDYEMNGGSLDEKIFHKLCIEFNTAVMDEVIYKGREFDMGFRLSTIEVVRADRDFKNKTINWNASNKLKEKIIEEGGTPYSKDNPEGEKWFVYYTDDWYCRINWNKSRCIVKNKTAYRFIATRGKIGNKTKLKNLLNSDELAHLKYRHLK